MPLRKKDVVDVEGVSGKRAGAGLVGVAAALVGMFLGTSAPGWGAQGTGVLPGGPGAEPEQE